ncbi:LysR family transcriptional regulator [Photobacterium sp. GJ3]|uniref:LysR substrate-binding domain-containing protein n=1 Tax=Photobacterium sp. GJ3 TaxID=2829502 RepID=UPI001B8BD707|nr:LysR substrate-binding domain-containing protein [Photobacterium sp. GJ3]QUJ68621.1 LysR family transcriptional regulator [Photobacterium sp. GJ3]
MNLDTKWLEDFVALCEVRNFSRAAEIRHITQPAFGRHIKSLEEAVGMQLVDRSTTPVSLTDAGKQFHSLARTLISQLDQGVAQIHSHQRPVFTPLRIATPHSLASPTLMNLMDIASKELTLEYSVDVLRLDYAIESLAEGRCDFLLAFDSLALHQPPFQNLCIGTGHFYLVSATEPSGTPIFTPSASSETPLLRYSPESYTARLIETTLGQPASFPSHPVFESSMCQLHKEMALRGKGVAWLPDCLIQEELAQNTLCLIRPDEWRIPYKIRLYRNQARLPDLAETFWRFLVQQTAQGWQLIREQ